MEGVAPAAPQPTEVQLRWLDLLPVLVFTVLGVILVFAGVVVLAHLDRFFYRANLETIALGATRFDPQRPDVLVAGRALETISL